MYADFSASVSQMYAYLVSQMYARTSQIRRPVCGIREGVFRAGGGLFCIVSSDYVRSEQT